jgi:hypothetical protein
MTSGEEQQAASAYNQHFAFREPRALLPSVDRCWPVKAQATTGYPRPAIQAACFKTATICLTERLFFLMANLPHHLWENPPENEHQS